MTGADFTPDIHTDPDQFSIHMGNGDGTFQAKVDYNTGINIRDITYADFDNDSDVDIAVTTKEVHSNDNDDVINIHLNNGDGTFQPKVTYSNGGRMPGKIKAAHLNGDANIDLVTSSERTDNNNIHIHLGNGDGTFQAETAYTVSNVSSFDIEDIDNDGDKDIVALSYSSTIINLNKVNVLLNNANGSFTPAVVYDHDYNTLYDVAISDINSDNKPDVITVSMGGVGVYLGNGDGTVISPTYYSTVYSTVYAPSDIIIEDFNGDSKLDFIVGLSSYLALFIHLGTGDGTVSTGIKYAKGGLKGLQRYDMNNDGKLDFIWAKYDAQDASGGPIPDNYSNSWVAILLGK